MSQDEHSVALAVFSGSLSSDELAGQIGIEPDESWSRGDRTPRGTERTRSVVRYVSDLSRETRPDEQISALLARVAPAAPKIADLAATPDGEVTLSIGYFINEPQWQERDDGTVVGGLGVSLDAAHCFDRREAAGQPRGGGPVRRSSVGSACRRRARVRVCSQRALQDRLGSRRDRAG